MSSQRYQRVNAHDDEDNDTSLSIALQRTPSSPPPSFRSRSTSPSSRRLLRNDPLHRNSADQTLADAFDDSGSEAGDEPDDRQRLMRAQPEAWTPTETDNTSVPAETVGSSSSSGASSEPQAQSNSQPPGLPQRRQSLLPFFRGTSGSGSTRPLPSSNDGVFANLAAKPERGEKTDDLPPSYEEAAADATPPYWETTIVAPGISSDEVYVDGLPVGSIFSFIWNAMISMSFQLVGFLLTYLLHTTHAAKNGSRAGLGLTLVQYGFYMKGGSESKGGDGNGSDEYVTPPDPNSHNFDPNKVVESASSGVDGGGGVSAITTSEWISYVLMIVGWFILIRAISDFLRARRHEQLVLQSPERGLPVPVIGENERSETVV
ncbi:metal homeostatis BSD2 family protein [Aspergillus lucknowensis]|uniref:Metal homeostatis protein bsd2 n=1 Tax=Aspergillus lucknowensis TaxID=176173 RepID=A0ABR4LM64_9EURO